METGRKYGLKTHHLVLIHRFVMIRLHVFLHNGLLWCVVFQFMFNEIIRISLRERENHSRAPTRIAPKIQIADQVSDVSMVKRLWHNCTPRGHSLLSIKQFEHNLLQATMLQTNAREDPNWCALLKQLLFHASSPGNITFP